MDQLMQIGKPINAPVFVLKEEKDPIKIYKHFEPEYKKYDLLIIDTAGRDALSLDLIEELKNVHDTAKPDESLLVISADIGQAAQTQAKAFHDAGAITGVIVTKMDGTAKGGGALSACAVTGAPIKFIGVGEKVDDFEQFNPKGFVGRLLGMGDLEALLEKAKEAITEEEAKDIEKKLLKGEFNLMDLYSQMEAMSKMGPLGKVLEMIPGLGQISLPKEALQMQEGKLKMWKHAMNSMTKKELEDPDVIDAQRIERISKGSGVSTSDIRDMIKQYKQSKKMVKMLKGESPEKLMKKLSKNAGPKLKF
jgi:signal recognition particle subunit SRP54